MNNNKLVIPSVFVLILIIFFSIPSSNFNLIDYVCASSSLSSTLECSKKTTDDCNLCFDNCKRDCHVLLFVKSSECNLAVLKCSQVYCMKL